MCSVTWGIQETQARERHTNRTFFCPVALGTTPGCDSAALVQRSKQPKCPKVLKGGCERCFRPSEVRLPKKSLARCETPFWALSPGAKHGLDGARDSFGTLGRKTPNHLQHPPLSTFGHFGCFDTSTSPAGSQTPGLSQAQTRFSSDYTHCKPRPGRRVAEQVYVCHVCSLGMAVVGH